MSMHEFEDVVEESIRCLEKSPVAKKLDLRSIFWNLYEFQGLWDTGITYFRLPEILIKHRFMYQIEVNQHPDYHTYRDFFDNLRKDSPINVYPDKSWHADDNPRAGYFIDGSIFFEVASPLWQRFVEKQRLTGADAVLPPKMDFLEIVEHILLEAEKQGNIELISYWYPLLAVHLYSSMDIFGDENELDVVKIQEENALIELQKNGIIHKIREIIYRSGAYLILHNYGFLKHPDEEEKKDSPFLIWWFEMESGDKITEC